jgi:prefoldin subunit 5
LLEQTKNAPLQTLRATRDTLDQLIRKHGATRENIDSLTNDLRLIGETINNLQTTAINLRPLTIDDNIFIEQNASSM